MGKPIDISAWTMSERSIRYRLTRDHYVVGILTGDAILPDGSANLSVTNENWGGQWWKPGMSKFGDKEKEWSFPANSTIDEDVIRQLRINTGALKPGSPLPEELQELLDIAVKGVIDKAKVEAHGEKSGQHPVAEESDGPSAPRKAATRNPELRRVVPKKG